MLEDVKKYLEGQESNPFTICIALRVRIEPWVYDYLSTQSLKDDFIRTHETQKIGICRNTLRAYPEIFYLLCIIYNSSLHIESDHIDVLGKCLLRNLTNLTIKKMIPSVCKHLR